MEREELEFEKKQNIGKRTAIIVVCILAATALCFVGINMSKKKKAGGSGPGAKGGWGGFGGFGGGNTVTAVSTMYVEPTTLKDFVTTNGDVQTQSSIDVFPSIGGKVVQVDVSLGSAVNAGDVIAYVDPSAAGVTYKRSPVTAPISGSIISTPVKTGQTVSTGSVITKIGDIDNLQVKANVPERYVGYLTNGLKAEITLEAYPDAVFMATVVRVSPVLDSSSRTKEVILHFDTKDSRINAGMFAKVKLYTKDYPNSVVVPQDALVSHNDKYYLYVVKEDDTVEKRQVTLGKNVAGNYQILSGINFGDLVVTAGMLTLADGSKVNDLTHPKTQATEDEKSFGGDKASFEGKALDEKTPAFNDKDVPKDSKKGSN